MFLPLRNRNWILAALWTAAGAGGFVGCGKKSATSMSVMAACEAGDGSARQVTACADALRQITREPVLPAGIQATASGLRMIVLQPGSGTDHPARSDRVRVHYTGWRNDGTVFDSSIPRGEPGLFTLTQMIPGWTEALEQMVPGEKRKLWIPANLAYGESPKWGNPAGDLTYDIELVEIIHSPKRPEDVAAPPKSAQVTASGLSYRVLRAGTGSVHPRLTDTVVVQYSGWTTDGLLFDSSLLRNRPGRFLVGSLIKGWIEAATTMVVGEKARFWMPASLAYGDRPTSPDAPAGMLVFDIELLEIQ
jgi:FKBP-type peptidyl-prolyl cis-trans isomerase